MMKKRGRSSDSHEQKPKKQFNDASDKFNSRNAKRKREGTTNESTARSTKPFGRSPQSSDRSERPKQFGNRSDRPKQFGNHSDKSKEFDNRSDRPKQFDNRSDRPKQFGNRSDRPKQFGNRSDRPKQFDNRSDRSKQSFSGGQGKFQNKKFSNSKGKKNDETDPKLAKYRKPNADLVTNLKSLWNRIREKNIRADNRKELVTEMFSLMTGKIYEISMKHDASRVIQAAIQFGDDAQRDQILSELGPNLVNLAKTQYAHFILVKLFTYCKKDVQRKQLLKSIQGNVFKLSTHSVSSKVVDKAFEIFPPHVCKILKAEFYGKEYSLFPDDESIPRKLSHILEIRPENRNKVLGQLKYVVTKLIEKSLVHFTYAQELICEFLENGKIKDILELIPTLSDICPQLLSSKAGAKAVALCAGYGNAKDRKRMIKVMKGLVLKCLIHSGAYLAIMKLVDVTDDTVSVQKLLLQELLKKPEQYERLNADGTVNQNFSAIDESLEPLVNVMLNQYGSKFILNLLSPSNTSYLDPSELEVMKPQLIPQQNSDESTDLQTQSHEKGSKLDEENESDDEKSTEKKENQKKKFGSDDEADEPKNIPEDDEPDKKKETHSTSIMPHQTSSKTDSNAILVSTSKKLPEVRRSEILAFLKEPLIRFCCEYTQILIQNPNSSQIIVEVFRQWRPTKLVTAIIEICDQSIEKDDKITLLYEDKFGHYTLKRILKVEQSSEDQKSNDFNSDDRHIFADALWNKFHGNFSNWIQSNRGCFVLEALIQIPSIASKLKNELLPEMNKIEKLSESSAGAKALLTQLQK